MNPIALRDYLPADAGAIDALAVTAFEQFKDAYADWPVFKSRIGMMSMLSAHGEIIVALRAAQLLLGAVAYIGPHRPKSEFFNQAWPIMRSVALPMYGRMGFAWHAAAPAIHGVAYGIYRKQL